MSFNTVVSVGGVAVGVMALLVVLSVMSGFYAEDLQKKILGANAHAVVLSFRGGIENYGDLVEKLHGEPHIVSPCRPSFWASAHDIRREEAHGAYLRGDRPFDGAGDDGHTEAPA
ncbi:MAG: hypothetical protein MZU91_05110 [Desulfosudis oleivorans]|nr:hypothetical protein [Desulfosudis oleivorans]